MADSSAPSIASPTREYAIRGLFAALLLMTPVSCAAKREAKIPKPARTREAEGPNAAAFGAAYIEPLVRHICGPGIGTKSSQTIICEAQMGEDDVGTAYAVCQLGYI